MGSSTAYSLSKSGKKVLLLEQFPLQHSKGSSHGQSRIIRRTYTEKHFSDLMTTSYALWNNFEGETKENLIVKTGGLDFGPNKSENLKKTIEICDKLNLNYQHYDNRELNKKFPVLRLPDNYHGIIQPESGVILADKALSCFQNQATQNHVLIFDNEPVSQIKINSSQIVVETSKSKYKTEKLILTSGLWTNTLLKSTGISLNLDIWKMSIAYWPVTNSNYFHAQQFPIFIAWEDQPFYGFPVIERKNLIKIAPHFTTDTNISPEIRDDTPNSYMINQISSFINRTFNYVNTTPIDPQTCYYSMSNDENFILDFHPDTKNIIIGAGFSGHGFKFAPLIGKILSELALGQESSDFDLSPFSIKYKLANWN